MRHYTLAQILLIVLGFCSLAVSYLLFNVIDLEKSFLHLTRLQNQISAVCFIILGAYLILKNRRGKQ